jgi:hypothetical protein
MPLWCVSSRPSKSRHSKVSFGEKRLTAYVGSGRLTPSLLLNARFAQPHPSIE